MYYVYYKSPLGVMTLIEEEGYLVEIRFGKKEKGLYQETPLLLEAIKQLNDYFFHQRKEFTLPYKLLTTPFRYRVLVEVAKIPYGTTSTYKAIAQAIGKDKAYQAIGQAIHHNPLPILIPCHRVIGSHHELTGYAYGLDKKAYLLAIEKVEH